MQDNNLDDLNNLIKNISMNDNNNPQGGDGDLQLFFLQGVENENRQLKAMLKKKDAELEEMALKNQKLEIENLLMRKQQLLKIEKELDMHPAETTVNNSKVSPTSNSSSKISLSSQMNRMKSLSLSCCSIACTDLAKTKALFVGNITNNLNREDLNDYFSKFGEIIYITIPSRSCSSGKGLRYAFIKFKDSDSVDKIMSMYNGHTIRDCSLLVNRAKDKY